MIPTRCIIPSQLNLNFNDESCHAIDKISPNVQPCKIILDANFLIYIPHYSFGPLYSGKGHRLSVCDAFIST